MTLLSVTLSLDLSANERTAQRENRSQRQNHQVDKQAQHRTERKSKAEQHEQKPVKQIISQHQKLLSRSEIAQRSGEHPAVHRTNKQNHTIYNGHQKHQNSRRYSKNHQRHITKQKNRRHNVIYSNQYNRYSSNHYRGESQYGRWSANHGHYHYDYRYRGRYNPVQWYDDYYYQSYFDWRWNRGNNGGYGVYYNDYNDPFYCPDGFTEFVTGLAVGALIYNW